MSQIPGEIKDRLKKLEKLRERGIYPFRETKYERTHKIKEITNKYSGLRDGQRREDVKIRVAGRVMAIRDMGKVKFMDLKGDIGQIQLYFTIDTLGKKEYEVLDLLDRGDILGVGGFVFKTHKGELSIWVKSFKVLSKAIRPLPSKWYGLKDVEKRYRQRYVDLIMNPEVREKLRITFEIFNKMREFLINEGFQEVKLPVLQSVYGGALAKPFKTYCNALDEEMFLRIAPELQLKRLIVGGIEKVFSISKNFRNEAIDSTHNPEFHMMECYWAYANYEDVMRLTEEMIAYIAEEILGTTKIEFQDHKIDLSPPWSRMTMFEAIERYSGIRLTGRESKEKLMKMAKDRNVPVNGKMDKGELTEAIFDQLVEPNLIQPTFITGYPIETSPLAKQKPDNPDYTERFEGFIAGVEIANAFSEQNNPLEQERQFRRQVRMRKELNRVEAHPMDKDYIRALQYGMPPTGGLGVGMERLAMLLTNSSSTKEVIIFPLMRKEKEIKTYTEDRTKP